MVDNATGREPLVQAVPAARVAFSLPGVRVVGPGDVASGRR